MRHCLATGGGLVTGWGAAQTALHYYWFRYFDDEDCNGCVALTDVGADDEDELMAGIPMVIVVESGWMTVVTIVVTVLPHFSISSTFLPLFWFGKQTRFFEPRGSV